MLWLCLRFPRLPLELFNNSADQPATTTPAAVVDNQRLLVCNRAAVDAGVPILGLCRGIQEMNVALGGTLHPEVEDLPGRHRHRMPEGCRDPEIIFELREDVRLRPGGVLAGMLGTETIRTNSLHGQAVMVPGPRVVVEGRAADDTIEAISVAGARSFAVGVQWHAEFNAATDPVNRVLYARFGEAARAYRQRRRAVAA